MKPKDMFRILGKYNELCRYVEERPKAILFEEGKVHKRGKIFSTYNELNSYIKQEFIEEWIKVFEKTDFSNGIEISFSFRYIDSSTDTSNVKLEFVNK